MYFKKYGLLIHSTLDISYTPCALQAQGIKKLRAISHCYCGLQGGVFRRVGSSHYHHLRCWLKMQFSCSPLRIQISNSRILKYIPSVHFNKLPWQFVSQIEGLYCWDLDYCWGKSQECGPQLQLAGMVLRALLCLLFTSNIFSIKWRWKGWLRECLRFLSPLRFLWGRDDILPWHPILGTLPSLLLSQSVTTCCHDLWEGMTQLQWIKNKNNQIPGFWISKGHVQTKVI